MTLGDYFGYPKCCQRAFKDDLHPVDIGLRFLTGRFTGLVPCPSHARMILAGAVTLESLIQHRVCPTPFPHTYRHALAHCKALQK